MSAKRFVKRLAIVALNLFALYCAMDIYYASPVILHTLALVSVCIVDACAIARSTDKQSKKSAINIRINRGGRK